MHRGGLGIHAEARHRSRRVRRPHPRPREESTRRPSSFTNRQPSEPRRRAQPASRDCNGQAYTSEGHTQPTDHAVGLRREGHAPQPSLACRRISLLPSSAQNHEADAAQQEVNGPPQGAAGRGAGVGLQCGADELVGVRHLLAAHGLTLDTCRQADLDRWLTDDSATYRQTAGHFIRWARTNKLTTVHVPAIRWNGPTQPLDDEHRWNIARRLLHNDTLKPEDRLAGLLLLLYAQGPAAIARLTIEDVEAGSQGVRLHLGDAPVRLPEPVAELARAVAANRKGHATIGALVPSPWLVPGGQPGRPISTTQLTQRLNQLGIRPNQARSTALFQLATEIPAAILARTLGVHTDVAVAWQRLSAGDWATYAAEVSQRPIGTNHHPASNT